MEFIIEAFLVHSKPQLVLFIRFYVCKMIFLQFNFPPSFDQKVHKSSNASWPFQQPSPKRPQSTFTAESVWQTRRKHRCVNIKSSNFSFAREIFYKWSEFASLKRDKFIRAATRRIFLFLIKMQIVDASVKDSLCGWLFNGWSLKRPSKSLSAILISLSVHLQISLRAFKPISFTRKICSRWPHSRL